MNIMEIWEYTICNEPKLWNLKKPHIMQHIWNDADKK